MARTQLQKLGAYLAPHCWQTSKGVMALLVVNALGVYLPLQIGRSIDELATSFDSRRLVFYVVLILLLASVMWGVRMASRVWLFGVGRQVEFDLKQRIFNHLLTLEPAYFAAHPVGDLINRATSDVDNIRRLLGFAVLSLANTLFAYGLTLPAMLQINVTLSLLALSVYPLMLILVSLFSDRLRNQQAAVQEQLSDLSELIQEDMSGIALIKIYAQEDNERLAFQGLNRGLLKANLNLARTRTLLFPLLQALAYGSALVLLWFGGSAIERGEITVGHFVALLIFVERLAFPTALLGFTISAYQRGEVSIDRIEAILSVQPEIQDLPTAQPLPTETVKGSLKATGLNFQYPGTDKMALEDVNFVIHPGETVAIVGEIGAGKSTLANALLRLIKIDPAQLFLEGQDITQITLQSLRSAIAYVPQESFLFSTTIADNIRYGQPLASLEQVEKAAQVAQIHPEILNFPQQYRTIVGERGITLSGGQRQRTALARALLVDSPILILDDALSSVDNQTATQILNNLSTGTARKTVLFISHQLSAAAMADRILVISQGRIAQMGRHADLLDRPGLYQSLWEQSQFEEALR